MRYPVLLLFIFLFCDFTFAQISANQQKALNSYVDYANQSAKEIEIVVEAIKSYYASLSQKRSWSTQRFSCPVQPDTYYFQNALNAEKILKSPELTLALKAYKVSADSLDLRCRELDTYYKLLDFKTDNHANGEAIVRSMVRILQSCHGHQQNLQAELEKNYNRLSKAAASSSYRKADVGMRDQIKREIKLIDAWALNLNESVHTGWPYEVIYESISPTYQHMRSWNRTRSDIKYPASSMLTSYAEAVNSFLDEKSRGVDEYNFETKKSDRHSNSVYLQLINYLNGTLIASYNTFIGFSERDGYYGLKMMQYFPVYSMREKPEVPSITLSDFVEVEHLPLEVSPQQIEIAKPVYETLTAYVDFINETWRQTRYAQMTLKSFNGSAAYYKSIESFEKRASMHFDFQDYSVPRSRYAKLLDDSKALSSQIATVLNAQAQTLLNLLSEIEMRCAWIDHEVETRGYEKDRLTGIYSQLERLDDLLEMWDVRKENFYKDVRIVFDSYRVKDLKSSWHVSGTSLRNLTDLSHSKLFMAKAFYQGDTVQNFNIPEFDAAIRDVISREYENMKGIEKIGRNNGLCPYTPYEDLPVAARSLSQKLNGIRNKPSSQSHRDPYQDLLYAFNNIIENHNKFCELSPIPLLKNVFQPEIFEVKYPDEEKPATVVQRPAHNETNTSKIPDAHPPSKDVKRDTVYIHHRDTVYIRESPENLRSMEGYATNNMVLLLDVSGSMNSPEKLPLLKKSIFSMLDMMRDEDELTIVTFSEKANVLLKPVSFKEEEKIRTAIDNLKSSGKTDANVGLAMAYKVADKNYMRGGNNRIILATDGEFPVTDETRKLVSEWAGQDIFLTIFYFGKNSNPVKSLVSLTASGKGNYEHISPENAEIKLIHEAKSKRKR